MAAGWCRSRPAATGTARSSTSRIIFVTAIGAGTTYPDYKPAPFIVSSEVDGVDMVTVVTEGIFSYCGVKVKIDTDRYLGPETATVRAQGEAIGHVTTSEYGSQMLSLGGVHHLTGGSKKEGRVTCDALMDLSNCKPVELTIDGGATVVVQAGHAPVVNGVAEERMRVGCGSATIGMFAKQWHGKVDEVVVVDDHITGVLCEHQAGKLLDIPDTGIKMKGRRSTPGRYFQVAEPGTGWGGTKISDPLSVLGPFDPKKARPGMTMLMVSTTGEHAAYLRTRRGAASRSRSRCRPISSCRSSASRKIASRRCAPCCSWRGAGGSLRAGVTDNPVRLTRSVKDALTRVTSGGAPVYVWPGGGITFMVDVTRLPAGAFGYVPTPALVAPIEFTLAAVGLCGAGRPYGSCAPAGLAEGQHRDASSVLAAVGAGAAAHDEAPADRVSGRRQAAASAGRPDRSDRGGERQRGKRARRLCAPRRVASPALLDELCSELPLLRQAADPARCLLRGKVARRMHDAVAPFAADCFITPMAAVAGAVAEEILGAMRARRAELDRAYVNNGGDIALHLANGEHFTVGLVDRPDVRRRDADHGRRCRRSDARGCHQRPPRPQLFARHCGCRHGAGADRVAGRRRRHHHRQRGRSARTSRHRALPGVRSAARQRSRRRAWSPATSARCRDDEIDAALEAGAALRAKTARGGIDRRRRLAAARRDDRRRYESDRGPRRARAAPWPRGGGSLACLRLT